MVSVQDNSSICRAVSSIGSHRWSKRGLLLAVSALIVAILALTAITCTQSASVSHVSPTTGGSSVESAQGGYNNNLENLISEFLDDAGDRLKKSKVNSLRQVKQTLRFGRRSDPLMAPSLDPVSWREMQENQMLAELGY